MKLLRNITYKERAHTPGQPGKEIVHKGYFHQWHKIFSGNDIAYTLFGLVETMEGKIINIEPNKITFIGKRSNPERDRLPPHIGMFI